MRKLLLAVFVLVPAVALAFELPKSAPKLPDTVNKQANDAANKAKDSGTKQAKDAAKDAVKPLNHDEQVAMCAGELPKQLECKEDFCTAMVEVRTAQDPKFKDLKDPKQLQEMRAKCLTEIAQDAAGDDAARKKKCEGWSKERGDMAINKTEADGMSACWAKANCKERVSCWQPKMATVMATTAAAKKAPPAPVK